MAYIIIPGTGTISIANGDTAFTGAGSNFTIFDKGTVINIGGFGALQVASDPTSDTAGTAVLPWAWGDVVDQPYEIWRMPDYAVYSGRVRQLIEAWNSAPPFGIVQTYSTSTDAADPGAGLFAFDNADPSAATAAYLDNLDTFGADISADLDTWSGGVLKIQQLGNAAIFATFTVSAVADSTGYRTLTLAPINNASSFALGAQYLIGFARTGAAGADGADGIFSAIASQAEAEAGTDNTKGMTPLRTAEVFASKVDSRMREIRASLIRDRVFAAGTGNTTTSANTINGGSAALGRTIVHADIVYGCRQIGLLRKVSINIVSAGDGAGTFKLKQMRPNGTSFDAIAESAAIAVGAATGIQTYELPIPLGPFAMGDKLAIWMSGSDVSGDRWTIMTYSDGTGTNTLYVDGDAGSGATYTALGAPGYVASYYGMFAAPAFVTFGDSLLGAGNGGASGSWSPPLDGGPTGNIDADPFYRATTRFAALDYQNFSHGGDTWADVLTTVSGLTTFYNQSPAVLIHCGINDIEAARTWAAVEADMCSVLAALDGVDQLFVDEIIPWGGDDTQAATIRDWNTKYASWCLDNGATLIKMHDALGTIRASTGYYDDEAYRVGGGDNHLTIAGCDIMGGLIADGIKAAMA